MAFGYFSLTHYSNVVAKATWCWEQRLVTVQEKIQSGTKGHMAMGFLWPQWIRNDSKCIFQSSSVFSTAGGPLQKACSRFCLFTLPRTHVCVWRVRLTHMGRSSITQKASQSDPGGGGAKLSGVQHDEAGGEGVKGRGGRWWKVEGGEVVAGRKEVSSNGKPSSLLLAQLPSEGTATPTLMSPFIMIVAKNNLRLLESTHTHIDT